MTSPGGDERSFLQERIARLGLFVALLAAGAWIAATSVYVWQGRTANVTAPSSIFHLVAVVALAGLWLFCRRGRHSASRLLHIETVGVVLGCAALSAAALEIKLEQRPELVLIYALTILLALRAALVPSSARHTLAIAIAVGVIIVPLVYLRYDREPDYLATASVERSLAWVTAWTAIWWSVTAFATTVISGVMYGLRRDVREAQQLGHYTLIARLGRGGVGEVWRASHRLLRRPAAIKLIRPEALSLGHELKQDIVARFEREAQATAALDSPHTVELFDFGVSERGALYHVMELLQGCDLETMVQRCGRLPPERVIYLLGQACDSLDDAHRRGLVHRDIKPANIFAARKGRRFDFVKVLDFGLVTAHGGEVGAGGQPVVGTPAYMAPEMIRPGASVDSRADIYALGCVGYWLLSGRPLFDHPTVDALLDAHLDEPAERPSKRTTAEVPAALDQALFDCVAKDPAMRPQAALALRARLFACPVEAHWSSERAEAWWEENRETLAPKQPVDPNAPTMQDVVRPSLS